MRILHIANFSIFKNSAVFYAIDRKISNGLTRNGHLVADFSYRDIAKFKAPFNIKKLGINKMHQAIFKSIDNLQPELILFGHSELIDTTTIEIIKQRYPQVKIAMWWVDPLKNLNSIKSKINCLDTLFITTHPKVLNKQLTANSKVKIAYLPNMCDSSIETYKAHEINNHHYDLLFAGRADQGRQEALDQIQKSINPKIKFKLVGTTKEAIQLGNQFLQTIGNSKMSLNLNRCHQDSLYSSDRIIQLMANGSLVISKSIPDSELLFNNNQIVFYNSIEECKEKIEVYYNNDSLRQEIAFNGWQQAHQAYNSTRVSKFMIETIFEQQYSEDYQWKKAIIKVY